MTIAPGAIVRVLRRGDVAFVVRRRDEFNSRRWQCVAKAFDDRENVLHEGVTVGEGDIVVVREAPTYSPGAQVHFNGVKHTVSRDLGESVELIVPSLRRLLRGGGVLRVAAGNTCMIAKSDLVLEKLT
jgi:hypothetical protein